MRDLAISLLLLRIFVTQELPAWPMTPGPPDATICACDASCPALPEQAPAPAP